MTTNAAQSRTEDEQYGDFFNEFAAAKSSGQTVSDEIDIIDKPILPVDEDKTLPVVDNEDPLVKIERLQAERDALKLERDDFQHKFQSSNGRISALQKKINAVEKPAEPKPLTPEEEEEQAKLTEALNLYPEFEVIAKSIEKKADKRISEVEQKFIPIEQSEVERYISSQVAELDKDIPDWKETVNSDAWDKWLMDQPEPMQQLAESESAKDYKYLFKLFRVDNPVDTEAVDKAARAAELTASRQQKLAASVTVKSKGASKTELPPDDYGDAFDYYAAKKSQRREA